MKKLFKVLSIFAVMAMTACGSNGGGSASKAGGNSSHTHTFDETRWESNETQHWHPATCEHTTQKGSAASHTFADFEDATHQNRAASCSEAGVKYQKCSVCDYILETEVKKLDHDWETQGNSATVDGAAATEQFKCSYGDHYALRWSAQAMDEAASLTAMGLTAKDTKLYSEINTSGSHSGSIRLKVAENVGGTKAYGTHAIYKINLGADATNIDLSFQIDPKSGFEVPVFDYVSNDDQQGYIEKADGTLALTTKRYGLRVNGVEVELGKDLHGNVDGGSKLWFNWNVKMNLTAGINTIDIYCLGGYRAYIYNFQLDGLTAAQLPAKAAA